MKTLKDMTDIEILKLSDEQIAQIIKYRKAQEWIRLLEKPIEPEYEETPEKDETYYFCNQMSSFQFTNSEDVEKIIKVIKENLPTETYFDRYSWRKLLSKVSWYERDYAEFKIDQKTEYSSAIKEEAEQIESRNNQLKKVYEKELEEYEEYKKDIQWIIDEVWNKVFEVREKYQKLLKLQNDYSQYLVLADNDEKIATSFLQNANTITDEELLIIKWDKITL